MRQKFEFLLLPSTILIGAVVYILINIAGLPSEFVYHFDASDIPDSRMSPISYLVVILFLQILIVSFVTAIEYVIRKTDNLKLFVVWGIRYVKFFVLGMFFSVTQELVDFNLTGDKVNESYVFGIAAIVSFASVALIAFVNNRIGRVG